MGYDIIGDIHGHAAKLESLLSKLGYTERNGLWRPPTGRQAVFLGDLIDRGPEQVKVLDIVRRMVDAQFARCILGNHEFNAIGYVTPCRAKGGFLRAHTVDKVEQHAEFLAQVTEGSQLHRDLIDWFRTLPPFLELGGMRVVHAWWHEPYVELVQAHWRGLSMSDDFLHAAYDKRSPLWAAMEGLTKGQEVTLPEGHSFEDHTGKERQEVRTKWWHKNAKTFQDVAIVPDGQEHRVPQHSLSDAYIHAEPSDAPTFVGHYWFKGKPQLLTDKVACLDWSAAGEGPLVAYRWDGETSLRTEKFVEAYAV